MFGQSVESLRSPSLQPKMSGSHEAPVPMNVDLHDHLAVMRLTVSAWADRVMREVVPADQGPGELTFDTGKLGGGFRPSWQLQATCGYLDKHAAWISRQPWVATLAPDPAVDGDPPATLVGALRLLLSRARGLAPWERQQVRLEATCDRCGGRTLVQFGGEDWVTCVAAGCDNVIGVGRYQNLARAEVRARSQVG